MIQILPSTKGDSGFPISLKSLLEKSNLIKVGKRIKAADARNLETDWGVRIPPSSLVELDDICRGKVPGNSSLKDLTELILRKNLPKDGAIRVSTFWDKPLTGRAGKQYIKYAALDAYASYLIWDRMFSLDPIIFSYPPPLLNVGPAEQRVLLDSFHAISRVVDEIPMHHPFRGAFEYAFRDAMFIQNQNDIANVNRVLAQRDPPSNVTTMMKKDPDWVLKRVQRVIPPPDVLSRRLNGVIACFTGAEFKDKKGVDLVSERVKKEFAKLSKHVEKGCLSDPAEAKLYRALTKDKDGLTIYHCARGTSAVESFHQTLEMAFEPFNAGPRYSDCCLALLTYRYNIRASQKHRPNFPCVGHYDYFILDRIQEVTSLIFEQPVLSWWRKQPAKLTNETFGICPSVAPHLQDLEDSEGHKKLLMTYPKALQYLANRTKVTVPYLGISTQEEQSLFKSAIPNYSDFSEFARDWNENQLRLENGAVFNASNTAPSIPNRIFRKFDFHLEQHQASFVRTEEKRSFMELGLSKLSGLSEFTACHAAVAAPELDVGEPIYIDDPTSEHESYTCDNLDDFASSTILNNISIASSIDSPINNLADSSSVRPSTNTRPLNHIPIASSSNTLPPNHISIASSSNSPLNHQSHSSSVRPSTNTRPLNHIPIASSSNTLPPNHISIASSSNVPINHQAHPSSGRLSTNTHPIIGNTQSTYILPRLLLRNTGAITSTLYTSANRVVPYASVARAKRAKKPAVCPGCGKVYPECSGRAG